MKLKLKRLMALCLAMMMLLCCLTACGNNESASKDPDTQQGTGTDDGSGIGSGTGTGDNTGSGTGTGTGTGDSSGSGNQQTPPPYTGKYSPLTGLPVADEILTTRPVAIMVNNLNKAQAVQSGLNDAQLIFETNVEGGITRLMAVYEDIASVGQIGTIRSARCDFVDLAKGLNAVFVHNGEDPTHCTQYLIDTNTSDFDLIGGLGKYSFRENNGLAYEHTLYANGSELAKGIAAKKWDAALSVERKAFVEFRKEAEAETPDGGACTTVTVKFSGSYITEFRYDSATQRYIRYFKDTLRQDYKSGEDVTVKNVFVLQTDTSMYPDNYLVNVDLKGGNGWYISNGGYESIKWSKSETNAEAPLVITKADGSTFTANAGNSWICLVDKDRAVTIK